MKVTNIEKLKEDLYSAMREMYFSRTHINRYAKSEYKLERITKENLSNIYALRCLHDCLAIECDNGKSLYLEFTCDMLFFYENLYSEQRFHFYDCIDLEYCKNRTTFFMEAVQVVSKFVYSD